MICRLLSTSLRLSVRKFATSSCAKGRHSFKMAPISPPGVIVNWDFNHLKPGDLQDIAKGLVGRLNKSIDAVVAEPFVSYDTVLKPLLDTEQWFRNESEQVSFPGHVAVDKTLRDASYEAAKEIEKAVVNVSMRVDLFNKIKAFKESPEASKLSAEKQRALDKFIRDGRRNGLELDETTREQVKAIKNELNAKALEFSQNLGEDKWEQWFAEEQLAGLPQTFLEGLEKNDEGKYKLTLKYPHLFPVTKMCKIPETRKIMAKANSSKSMVPNTKLLEDMLELRQKEAELLGYKNHAEYAQEELMAKNPEKVQSFLRELAAKLQPLWAKERAKWLSLKEKEFAEAGWEFNGKIEPWDSSYYQQKIEETEYAVNPEDYKPYFPIRHVTQGLLSIYQNLLNLTFTPLPDAPTWHPEVEAFQVTDTEDGGLLGYFYLDLYPREGKYGHACVVPLQHSCDGPNGERIPTVVAMLCNFPKPSGDRPALLDHDFVNTFFHEFGHAMHSICSKTETVIFSGCTGVERDFLEAPSQMLENWVWHKAPLAILSKHYETGEPLPSGMVDKLVHSKKANAGAFNLRQITLALYDQTLHTKGRCDTAKTYEATVKEILDLEVIPETNFGATFNHLAGGYSARYYSYLWSEVFSMDMFESVFGEDVLLPEKGMLYRKRILEPAGSKDAADLLRDFLGRDPKPEPFLKSKGLEN